MNGGGGHVRFGEPSTAPMCACRRDRRESSSNCRVNFCVVCLFYIYIYMFIYIYIYLFGSLVTFCGFLQHSQSHSRPNVDRQLAVQGCHVVPLQWLEGWPESSVGQVKQLEACAVGYTIVASWVGHLLGSGVGDCGVRWAVCRTLLQG